MTDARRLGSRIGLMLLGLVLVGCDDESGGSAAGGSGSLTIKYEGKTTTATIDEANVEDAAEFVLGTFPGCTDSPAPSAALSVRGGGAVKLPTWLGPYGLRGTAPADSTGDCGGTATFKDYSHSEGVTTGTLSLIDYCAVDPDGEEVTVNADVPFVDNGITSDMGPVRQSLTANCPEYGMDSADGRSVSGGFVGMRFVPATPGQTATDSEPNTVTVRETVARDNTTGESTRGTNLTFTAGATEHTVSGEVCYSELGCVTVATDAGSPITVDPASRSFTGGTITLEGASGSTAELEVVPGPRLGVEVVAIDGEPVPPGTIEVVCSAL